VAILGAKVLVCREDWSATKDDFAMTARPNTALSAPILEGRVAGAHGGLSVASVAS
jgi:hypothetical protein